MNKADEELLEAVFSPPHNWLTFWVRFKTIAEDCEWLPLIPHNQAPKECRWARGATLQETACNYKQAEDRFLSEIETAVRIPVPGRSRPVLYFLGTRATVVEEFLAGYPALIATIIPFPSLRQQRVLEWFLIDWWRQSGTLEMARSRYLKDPGE